MAFSLIKGKMDDLGLVIPMPVAQVEVARSSSRVSKRPRGTHKRLRTMGSPWDLMGPGDTRYDFQRVIGKGSKLQEKS